jgi:hypothetical protein
MSSYSADDSSAGEERVLVEDKKCVKAEDVLRKVDRNLLYKFFILTILCYIDRLSVLPTADSSLRACPAL